jgi:hypothetical protein
VRVPCIDLYPLHPELLTHPAGATLTPRINAYVVYYPIM